VAKIVIALIGSGYCKMHCDDCTRVGNLVSDEIILPSNIQTEVDMILDAVCSAAPADSDCENKLPGFWQELAQVLFSREFGWFAPQWICVDECAAEDIFTRNLCDDCVDKLNARNTEMGAEESIIIIMEALNNGGWCEATYPDAIDSCMAGVELLLPIAFPIFAADNSWTPTFCDLIIGC